MKFNLNNKVAIVTGASQGIGETIAVEMANSGAYVICLARNKDALDSTINIIEKNGKQAVAYSCDISNNDQFNQIIKIVIEEHEKIDILVDYFDHFAIKLRKKNLNFFLKSVISP